MLWQWNLSCCLIVPHGLNGNIVFWIINDSLISLREHINGTCEKSSAFNFITYLGPPQKKRLETFIWATPCICLRIFIYPWSPFVNMKKHFCVFLPNPRKWQKYLYFFTIFEKFCFTMLFLTKGKKSRWISISKYCSVYIYFLTSKITISPMALIKSP